MIDIHSHVLPNVDDGAHGIDETLAMLRIAEADGIGTIVTTPHYDGTDPDVLPKAASALQQARLAASQHGIDVQLCTGFELSLTPELLNDDRNWTAFGLNGSRYVLVEGPVSFWSYYVEDGLFRLQLAGLRPILAHAERYERIIEDVDFASELVDRGIWLQVNADSLTGNSGRVHAQCARTLVSRGLVSFLATDSHSAGRRAPRLKDGAAVVAKMIGAGAAETMVTGNPQAVLLDTEPVLPTPVQRAPFFSFFSRLMGGTDAKPAPSVRPAITNLESRG